MHYWRSQGVGYIYVAGGIPQIQMMTQTGAAEQHGHQIAVTSLLLSSGASVSQQPPKAELPTMSTSPAESRPARSTAGSTLPTRARVVVIGGGVIGSSVAYHLAQMGCPDVVLLERDRLTSGTTWHAAGLMVTFGSTSQTSTEMRKYTRDLYARLEAETGLATGFNPVGFIEIATEPVPEVSGAWPILEDPASHGYFREEGSGLMIGLFEPVCAPWKVEGIPSDFSFGELPPDWDRMGPYLETAMSRIPISKDVGIRKFFCGPESFTPDLAPVVGEAPELKNYFVAAGLNSVGILTGGGLGRVIAHWILNGRPDVDVTGMNIDRLHRYQTNPDYRRARTVESLGTVYLCHYPTKSMQTARGIKHSAVHGRLAAERAYFKDVSGWEGADWFAPEGVEPVVERLSWGRQSWFPYWEAEHRAAREGVILMDMSFMAKFAVQGRDAGRLLDRLSANNVAGPSGMFTYTQWLNDGGLIEADLTVTKLGDENYFVVASDTAQRHVETWMRRHIGPDENAFVTDVTSGYAQLNIQGPRSRELLAAITTADLSNEAFPFRTAREIDLGFARALCVRITYLGELGYELYVPTEQALYVYDRVAEAGRSVGLRHAGLKALSSLRMEKGYRDYGHDIDNTDCVLEVGLGFAVDLRRPTDFIGRRAVEAKKVAGPLTRRLVQILVKDPEPMLFHAEVVRRNGVPVGYIRAASYGFTLGGAVGLAMIEADEPLDQAYLDGSTWEVDIAGRTYPAVASLRPMYDPTMSRVKS